MTVGDGLAGRSSVCSSPSVRLVASKKKSSSSTLLGSCTCVHRFDIFFLSAKQMYDVRLLFKVDVHEQLCWQTKHEICYKVHGHTFVGDVRISKFLSIPTLTLGSSCINWEMNET